jgi:hypothetical protein
MLNQNIYMPEHSNALLIPILNMETAPTSERSSTLPTSTYENDCENFVEKVVEKKPVGGIDTSWTKISYTYFDVCVRNSQLSYSSIVSFYL